MNSSMLLCLFIWNLATICMLYDFFSPLSMCVDLHLFWITGKKILHVKYFQVFGMTSKILKQITKTRGLATVARGPMIELPKLATNDYCWSDVSNDQTAHVGS